MRPRGAGVRIVHHGYVPKEVRQGMLFVVRYQDTVQGDCTSCAQRYLEALVLKFGSRYVAHKGHRGSILAAAFRREYDKVQLPQTVFR